MNTINELINLLCAVTMPKATELKQECIDNLEAEYF